ncbi:MAG: PqiC family protein [Opitutaceae bacterium]|nr:PqiC family protein [Opitutaceae bacterium]
MTRSRDPDAAQRSVLSVAAALPWALSSVACLLLLAGCSIPLPQAEADPTRFYVLSTTGAGTAPAPAGPVVHLRQVEVASYLDARPMIVRRGENEIGLREFARWGEPLDLGVGRVLREELLARGATGAVLASGLRTAGLRYDYELGVRVLSCEGGADGSVLFRAVWELNSSGTKPEPVARGDYRAANLRWDGKTESSLAAQLSQAVSGLAAEISAALKK